MSSLTIIFNKTLFLWARALVLGVIILSASPIYAQSSNPELKNVPHPEIASLQPEIQALLKPARAYFDKHSVQQTGRELGITYGRLGLHYQAHELQDAARVCFQNAIALDNRNYRWPYYLAVHFEETGDFEQAIKWYARSLEINSENIAGATRMGLALYEVGELEQATKLLETVIGVAPESAAALAGLGKVAVANDENQKAVDYFTRALELQPQATQLHYQLGLAWRELGNTEKARLHLGQRGDRIPSIPDFLLALMNAHTRSPQHYIDLGKKTLEAGRPLQAATYFNFAEAISPGNQIAINLRQQAQETARKMVEQSKQAQQQTAKPGPGHFDLGRQAEREGDDKRAIDHYTQAVKKAPEAEGPRLLLANALMRNTEFKAAATHYGVLAENNAQDPEYRYRQGLAWLAAKNCQQAEQSLLAGFQLDPRAARVIQALARSYAVCPVDAAKRGEALKYAKLLYDAQPTLETSATLAMVLASLGKFEEAQDYQRQAIFESLKNGSNKTNPQLTSNLERYVEGKSATIAWPLNHRIYSPPSLRDAANGS